MNRIHHSPFQKRVKKNEKSIEFDKYDLYHKAVQSAESDVVFLEEVYKELRKKPPKSMREDFGSVRFSVSG